MTAAPRRPIEMLRGFDSRRLHFSPLSALFRSERFGRRDVDRNHCPHLLAPDLAELRLEVGRRVLDVDIAVVLTSAWPSTAACRIYRRSRARTRCRRCSGRRASSCRASFPRRRRRGRGSGTTNYRAQVLIAARAGPPGSPSPSGRASAGRGGVRSDRAGARARRSPGGAPRSGSRVAHLAVHAQAPATEVKVAVATRETALDDLRRMSTVRGSRCSSQRRC